MVESVTAHAGRSEQATVTSVPTLLLTPDETAKALRLSVARVYELLAAGVLPSIKIGKSRRVPVKALQEWIAAQQGE